jgi:hypothetical protein
MNIKIGEYVLKSDQYCVWLVKLYERKGKMVGRQKTGYFHSFKDLLEDLVNKSLLESEATDIQQLRDELAQVHKDVKKIGAALDAQKKHGGGYQWLTLQR